jgi:hypothetical protein
MRRREFGDSLSIVLGLNGMNIEERAKEIVQYLSRLQGDLGKFRETSIFSINI